MRLVPIQVPTWVNSTKFKNALFQRKPKRSKISSFCSIYLPWLTDPLSIWLSRVLWNNWSHLHIVIYACISSSWDAAWGIEFRASLGCTGSTRPPQLHCKTLFQQIHQPIICAQCEVDSVTLSSVLGTLSMAGLLSLAWRDRREKQFYSLPMFSFFIKLNFSCYRYSEIVNCHDSKTVCDV